MDIIELGTQLLSDKLGLSASPETINQAMSSLLGDGQGNVDLQGLATKMASNADLGAIVNSWLGDGGNSPISADALLGLLGENQVADFAGKLGTRQRRGTPATRWCRSVEIAREWVEADQH